MQREQECQTTPTGKPTTDLAVGDIVYRIELPGGKGREVLITIHRSM